ncbi:MAG: ComF family protein [Nitrospinae bacterium]|nr:ComF family protein [Nitrospinota bacterium]
MPGNPKAVLKNIWDAFSGIVFPASCAVCKAPLPAEELFGICPQCKEGLVQPAEHACLACAMPIDGEVAGAGILLCGDCRISLPPFDLTVSGMGYGGKTRELVHRFKFQGKTGLSRFLASTLCARLYAKLHAQAAYIIVIPVPLHRKRIYARGYNQSFLLAEEVGMALSLPVETGVLIRAKYTDPQSKQTRAERLKSIKGAFAVARPEMVEGNTVILVDDIMTTGATLAEAAKTLKKAGAKSVICAVAARA